MYYTERERGHSFYACSDYKPEIARLMPIDSVQPLPPNPLLEEEAEGVKIPEAIKAADAKLVSSRHSNCVLNKAI